MELMNTVTPVCFMNYEDGSQVEECVMKMAHK